MESYIARISEFERYLSKNDGEPVIDLKEFKTLCFRGIPDKPGLRQLCWKVLLGYLPPEKSKWDTVLMEQRKLYYSFVKDLIVDPELGEPPGRVDDDEFSGEISDEWSSYFQDNKLLEQIDKDVRRTLPDFAFFQLPIPYSPLCPLSTDPKSKKSKKKSVKVRSTDPLNVSTTVTSTESSESLPGLGFVQKKRSLKSMSMDFKKISLSCPSNSPLKRRQTVTVMSPAAGRKFGAIEEGEQHHSPMLSSSPSMNMNGAETPHLQASGFRTPNNHASPIPSRLKGIPVTLAEIDSDGDENETDMLPDYLFSPIPTRRSLFKRVAHLNQDFGCRQHQPHSLQAFKSKDSWKKSIQVTKDGDNPAYMIELSSQDYSDDISSEEDELPQDLHWEAIERILYIYAKLNPGVGYVQGMNEILGPLYYLLAIDTNEDSQAHAEAESFWLFHLLMAHSRDHFVRSLDRDRTSGIGSTIARMNLRLREFDEPLWRNLEEKGIAPEYYSFRWLTVLFTQEFEVPDVWRIWDSVLADACSEEKQDDFLLDFGCAMVCQVRTDLVNGDFADNIKLLQNYPPVDIQPILQLATIIRELRINGSYDYTTLECDNKVSSGRPSLDLRIWSTGSSTSEYQGGPNHNMNQYVIDGVHGSDRLDHNLEGIDQRSLSSRRRSGGSRKEGSVSGLNIDSESGNPNLPDANRYSPSNLSVDTYYVESGSRPQTSTWSETFAQIKMRFVGSGSTSSNTAEVGAFGTLSPSVEL